MTAQTLLGTWPAEATAVPAARRAVRSWLRDNGRMLHSDAASLVVSELVGNVVLHVGGQVEVRIGSAGDDVLLEVRDDSPVPPRTRMFSPTSSTGRGMRLVHSMSAAHGVRLSETGKTVWVRLTADAARRTEEHLSAQFAEQDWLGQATADPSAGHDGGTAMVRLRRSSGVTLRPAA